MRVPTLSRLTLSLLIAGGMGVSGAAASGQTKAKPGTKPTAAKAASGTHHKRSKRKPGRRERGQKAPEPERISEIQQALAKDGSFGGTPSGKWDSATVDALKKFQDSHGLTATGKLDAKTLQKLGFGSQTAGVAAPMPPVSSSTLTTGTSPSAPHKQ